jgi:HlyD family type I secretion membrane fusion protein
MSETLPTAKPSSHSLAIGADVPVTMEQRKRMRGPMVAGGVTVLVFVVGFLIWAAVFSIAGGEPAPGFVMVENNRKTVEHLDGGIVRQIRVRDGDRVHKGQVLFVMDDTQARAQFDVLQGQYDSLLAQRARLEAELAGASSVEYPPELTSRASDPRVARLMQDQNTLFRASLGVYTSQAGVLNQKVQELQSQITGLKAQVASVDQQNKLVADELKGVQSLYDQGFAPKTRLLGLQRNQASLVGDRGARQSQIAQVDQAIGETRIQMAQIKEQRATQAADTLRQVQTQIADVVPRMKAAQEALDRTQVRAPTDGVALALTQFTEGGVVKPGERMVDIVPQNTPLVVRVSIRPDHIAQVHKGMTAKVTLSAYHDRSIPPVNAKVLTVGADRITNEKGESYFTADLAIDPSELKKLPNVHLEPGMPAQAMIITGERSILKYLLTPFTDTFRDALREQ